MNLQYTPASSELFSYSTKLLFYCELCAPYTAARSALTPQARRNVTSTLRPFRFRSALRFVPKKGAMLNLDRREKADSLLTSIVIISFIVALTDIALALLSLSRRDKGGIYLGLMMFMAAVVDLTYTASVLAGNDFQTMSWFSSAYFSSVTLLCLFLTAYISNFTEHENHIISRRFAAGSLVYGIIDIFFMMTNPLTGLSIDYTYSATAIAHWRYDPHLTYDLHLLFTYLLIVFVVINLVVKIRLVPKVYRRRFRTPLITLLVVVLMNAAFLYLPAAELFDFSVYFYSIAGLIFYLNHYRYSKRLVTADSYKLALNEMDSIVVFFDYKQRFVSCNNQASVLIPEEKQNQSFTLSYLVAQHDLGKYVGSMDHDVKFAWNARINGEIIPWHCSLKLIREDHKTLSGYLLICTDSSLETDLLTGFHTKAAFDRTSSLMQEEGTIFPRYSLVVACDINGLSLINSNHGRTIGDEALRQLSQALVAVFPSDTYFVRQEEGTLFMICADVDGQKVDVFMKTVMARLAKTNPTGEEVAPFRVQYATCSIDYTRRNAVQNAALIAIRSMRNRKLLDPHSTHASLLASLAQAQRQNDGETEDHVARTRQSGELLGMRLHLTDLQQSTLALICLLHDIGKIGIPLEILNKPTKLSDAEWEVMKSHTIKGFEIANASPELSGIAKLILCHHERWDGKGYPLGLSGERIPLLSRILSVVDTYDAMTHDRPYRRALTTAEAKDELQRCAGTQFDPTLVKAFLDLLEEHPELAVSDADDRLTYSTLFEEIPEHAAKPSEVSVDSNEENRPTSIPHGRYFLDENNVIIGADEGFTAITGYTESEALAKSLTQYDLIPPECFDEYLDMVRAELDDHAEAYLKHRILRKDGATVTVFCFGRSFYDPVARAMRNEVIITQVS